MCTLGARLDILKQVPFFRDLQLPDLEWVNSQFHQEDYHVDEVICHSGDPAAKFFVVAEGHVRLLQHSLSGKEFLLDLLSAGEFFGAISGRLEDSYTETVQAHSACCILAINNETYQKILMRYSAVALQVIEIVSNRLQAANVRLHQLSTLPVEGRISSLLLMLGDKFGARHPFGMLLQVPLTRENLAEMAGTTTESSSRVMSQFQKAGLIRSGRGWVALADRSGLEEIAGREVE